MLDKVTEPLAFGFPPYTQMIEEIMDNCKVKKPALFDMMIVPRRKNVFYMDAIAELYHCLIMLIERGASDVYVITFMHKKHEALEFRTPIKAIKHGHFGDVCNLITTELPELAF